MNPKMTSLAVLSVALVVLMAPGLSTGQEVKLTPLPFPEEELAPQELIAWSGWQKPQPAPQPLPPRDTPIPQRDQQQDQNANPRDNPSSPALESQTFTGKIVKDGASYVLKVAGNTTYQLDSQAGLKQYENQSVRIVGTLDAGGTTIHATKIELIS